MMDVALPKSSLPVFSRNDGYSESRLDAETLSIVAKEFGFVVEFVSAEAQDLLMCKMLKNS